VFLGGGGGTNTYTFLLQDKAIAVGDTRLEETR